MLVINGVGCRAKSSLLFLFGLLFGCCVQAIAKVMVSHWDEPSPDELRRLAMDACHRTWAKLSAIQASCGVELMIDECVLELNHQCSTENNAATQDNNHFPRDNFEVEVLAVDGGPMLDGPMQGLDDIFQAMRLDNNIAGYFRWGESEVEPDTEDLDTDESFEPCDHEIVLDAEKLSQWSQSESDSEDAQDSLLRTVEHNIDQEDEISSSDTLRGLDGRVSDCLTKEVPLLARSHQHHKDGTSKVQSDKLVQEMLLGQPEKEGEISSEDLNATGISSPKHEPESTVSGISESQLLSSTSKAESSTVAANNVMHSGVGKDQSSEEHSNNHGKEGLLQAIRISNVSVSCSGSADSLGPKETV